MADFNVNLTIQNIWLIFRVVIDIVVTWIAVFYAIKFVRNNSRTIQIFKGILAILIVDAIAKFFGLTTVAFFCNLFINWGLLAIIIIFQPEIRSLLEKIGKTNAFSKINTLLANEKEKLAEELYEATIALSESRVGALISIEQSQSMQDYIRTGVIVNASVSKELLSSIFMTTTPLHDGAVIIQGDKVACASAYFPPTNVNLASRYGARHRAALGISEVTDALTIVVSEETSAISIAEKGRIFTVDKTQLKDYLRRVICNDEIEIEKNTRNRNSLLNLNDDSEIVVTKADEDSGSLFQNLFRKKDKTAEETVKKESDMKTPFNNRIKYEQKMNAANSSAEKTEMLEIKDGTVRQITKSNDSELLEASIIDNTSKEGKDSE